MFHNSRPSPIFRQGSLIRSKEGPSIMITENSTNAAIWPTSMPSSDVKTLVERFFTLVDTNSDDVGQKLAEEVFTPDAVFITANTTFQGQAEILQSRKGAWSTVKRRRHTILKSYVNDVHGTDIIFVGNLKMEALDGTKTNLEFVARMKIEEQWPAPRISQYQVISPSPKDSRPILDSE